MASEWPLVKLSDVLETIIDYRGKTPPKSSTGIPTLSAASVKDGRVLKDKVSFISQETYNKITTRGYPQKGDVLITTEAPCGEVAPFPTDQVYHITRRIMSLRGDPRLVDSNFLLYTLFSNVCQKQLAARVRGTTVSRVLKTDITGLKFGLPPLTMQKSISGFLSSIDNKIELNRQTNETLEKMAQALFKSWFVDFDPVIDNALEAGNTVPDELQNRAERRQQQLAKPDHQPLPDDIRQLFPSEFELTEELGWVPMGWEVKPLDEIAHYQNGLALQKFRPENESQFLPVLKIAHLKKGYTDGEEKAATDIKPSCIVDNGDIVFSWSGSLMVDIWCGGKAALNQHLFKVTSEIFPRWFYYFFTVHHLVEFQRIAADKAVTMGHIKREHLSQAKCAVPTVFLLAVGSQHIESLMEQKIILRKESKQLEKLRDTLLPKLISGELRLPSDALSNADQQLSLHVILAMNRFCR